MDALGTLQRLGGGRLIDEVYDALCAVAAEVARTGKPGEINVKLKVSHPQGSDPALVVVDEELKRTPPKLDPRGAMFFAVDGLHARDPRQPELPSFRVVDEGGQTTLREPRPGVDPETGEILREVSGDA